MTSYYADEGQAQDFLAGVLPCAFLLFSMALCALIFFGGRSLLEELEPADIVPEAPVPLAAVLAVPRYSWSSSSTAAYSEEYVINVSMEGVMEFYQQQGAACTQFNAPGAQLVAGYRCTGSSQPFGEYQVRIHRQSDIELTQGVAYPAGETMLFLQVEWQR